MLIIFKWSRSAKFPKNTPFKSRLHPNVGGFCRVLRQKVYGRNCEAGKPITELPVQCPGSPDSVPGAEGRRCIRLSPIYQYCILSPLNPDQLINCQSLHSATLLPWPVLCDTNNQPQKLITSHVGAMRGRCVGQTPDVRRLMGRVMRGRALLVLNTFCNPPISAQHFL